MQSLLHPSPQLQIVPTLTALPAGKTTGRVTFCIDLFHAKFLTSFLMAQHFPIQHTHFLSKLQRTSASIWETDTRVAISVYS
jgi:hypothetical protein